MLDQRTIEILAQVVFKEMKADNRELVKDRLPPPPSEMFWRQHKEETLELARNILRVSKTINPTK